VFGPEIIVLGISLFPFFREIIPPLQSRHVQVFSPPSPGVSFSWPNWLAQPCASSHHRSHPPYITNPVPPSAAAVPCTFFSNHSMNLAPPRSFAPPSAYHRHVCSRIQLILNARRSPSPIDSPSRERKEAPKNLIPKERSQLASLRSFSLDRVIPLWLALN